MSDYLQPGMHPDPDSLSAFMEGVLPEHERLQCVAHLADCPACREIVYLAQEPLPAEPQPALPPEKVSFWKRWLTPIPALSAAMAVGILVLSVWLYQQHRPAETQPKLVATLPRPVELPTLPEPSPQPMTRSVPTSKITAKVRTGPTPAMENSPVQEPAAPSTTSPRSTDAISVTAESPAVSVFTGAPVSTSPAAAPPAPALPVAAPRRAIVNVAASLASDQAQSGIAGTVTDPSGAAVAGAKISVHPLENPAGRDLTSDSKGQFNVAGLEPGQYELQVSAPGFQRATKQVEIQARQVARVDSILALGSVADSITVQAAIGQVMTESSSVAVEKSTVQPLPSKLPAQDKAASGKLMLSTDSAGALFLSTDAGRKWKTVKPVWRGKVVSLVALTTHVSPSDPVFLLTTDAGVVWLSRDGSRWYAAPTPH